MFTETCNITIYNQIHCPVALISKCTVPRWFVVQDVSVQTFLRIGTMIIYSHGLDTPNNRVRLLGKFSAHVWLHSGVELPVVPAVVAHWQWSDDKICLDAVVWPGQWLPGLAVQVTVWTMALAAHAVISKPHDTLLGNGCWD